MNIAVFGGFGKRALPAGWTKETAVALVAGGEFDLTGVTPGENALLTAVAIFGSIDVSVDPGTNVRLSGFNLFGSREVEVEPGPGPSMRLRAVAVFGAVTVKSRGELDD